MAEDTKELAQKYLRKAFVNNSYNELSTHLALRKTWENSFSYLYALQRSYIGYEEYQIDLKKADEDYKELHRLYFNKSYKPCFDIERKFINICNDEEYRKSSFYKQNISLVDICNNPDIFDKMPVIIIDDHVIWDYEIYITDSYTTIILSLSSNFIFEYERNGDNDKRVYKEHKLQVLLIDNAYYQRIAIKKEALGFNGKSITISDSIIKDHLITSRTATTSSCNYKQIPDDDGILFCSIHIPVNKKDYELGTVMIDMTKNGSSYKAQLTNDVIELLSETTETFYVSFFFFNHLHLHTYYNGNSYATTDYPINEPELACLTREINTAYNMPIPIENCILMKKDADEKGYKLIHNVDNLELFYPCFYHVADSNQKSGNQYKLFYFYQEGYDLKYTCIHDFFFYFVSLSNGRKDKNIECIMDMYYRKIVEKTNLSTDNEHDQFYDILIDVLTYYSYIHKYGDIDFIHRYNDDKTYTMLKNKSIEYKNETLREWIKKEPFVLRDYVLEQKKKGCSFYIFTNTVDLSSRKRNDISTEFPDIVDPHTFTEPHYVFSTLNDEELDHDLNIRVFVDGLFVEDLYQKRKEYTQYIYIPASMITEDSFIEVEFVRDFHVVDRNVTFDSLDSKKSFVIASKDFNVTPTNADLVVYDDKETGTVNRYDTGFFDIDITNEYGEFKTAHGTAKHPLRFVSLSKFTLQPNDEEVLNKPLKIRLSKSAEGIRYIVPRDGEVFLEFVDNSFGYNKDFIRVYHNGRIMPRQKYMFYPMYHYPRIRFLDEMKKDDVLYIDVSPYRYTQVYYQEDISPTEDILDLKTILNKPFDIRYYDVYLNGRKLSINNAITMDPWSIKFINLHSKYNLLIFEKERDYEYYGVDYTLEQFYFTIEEFFKRTYMTDSEKEKVMNFLIETRKEDERVKVGDNVNDEDKEDYPDIGEKYIYYLFDSFYYDELIPKTFMNPDIGQLSFLVMYEWYREIYDLYLTSPYLSSCEDEPNAKRRRSDYMDCICLNPDLQYDGLGKNGSQLVYSVGHLNEISKAIRDMEIEIKTRITVDKYVKDDLDKDEELEV